MGVEVHLQEERLRCRLRQADVCEVLPISKGYLSKLENGLYLPKLSLLGSLGRLYVCHPFDFLAWHNYPLPRLLREWRCPACGQGTPLPEEP